MDIKPDKFPLVLSLGTTKKSLGPSPLQPPLRYLFMYINRIPSKPFLLHAKHSQLYQSFLMVEMLQPLKHLPDSSV